MARQGPRFSIRMIIWIFCSDTLWWLCVFLWFQQSYFQRVRRQCCLHLSGNTSIHEQRWFNTLFFFCRRVWHEKCKSQKTAVLDGTPLENWSYYRLRITKWVNILIKWQDLIKTWESLLRVSHTERQCVRRASCAHQTLITRHLTDYTFIFLRNHNWRLSQVLVSSFSSCSEYHPLLPSSIASVSANLPY